MKVWSVRINDINSIFPWSPRPPPVHHASSVISMWSPFLKFHALAIPVLWSSEIIANLSLLCSLDTYLCLQQGYFVQSLDQSHYLVMGNCDVGRYTAQQIYLIHEVYKKFVSKCCRGPSSSSLPLVFCPAQSDYWARLKTGMRLKHLQKLAAVPCCSRPSCRWQKGDIGPIVQSAALAWCYH